MASAVYVTQTQGMSDLIATQRSAQTIKKCTMVPFFGAKSSWFGWEKLVFSLGFHLRLWPGSFWGIQHLPELKIAKIFFFHGFRASCDDRVVLTTGRAFGILLSYMPYFLISVFWNSNVLNLNNKGRNYQRDISRLRSLFQFAFSSDLYVCRIANGGTIRFKADFVQVEISKIDF